MAGNKDIPRVKNPPSGDGHHVTHRYMTATELAERDARQKLALRTNQQIQQGRSSHEALNYGGSERRGFSFI
ncbi:hypothetical protein BZL43_11325 [Pseudomonas sp. PICF141]|nr:hypothetical protein BZL43_11325 [Pseudomonas sp. PICF141]